MGKSKESPTVAILGGGRKTKTKKAQAAENTDYIAMVVNSIENLKDEQVLVEAREIADGVERDYFRLGGLLDRIHGDELYVEAGYSDFGDYVADTFGFRRSKALYLVQIYNALVDADVDWKEARDLTWCKLRLIAQVITKKNANKWIKHARKTSVAKLLDHVKQVAEKRRETAADGGGGEDGGRGDSGGNGVASPREAAMATLSFRLHADQQELIASALGKAKEAGDTASDSVALYYICTSFLQDGKVIRVTGNDDMVKTMKRMKPMEVLNKFTEAHPKFHVTVTEQSG